MSRIHEALKKAEQERQHHWEVPYIPISRWLRCLEQSRELIDTDKSATVAAAASSSHASPGLPSLGSPFSLETMLARCAAVQWSPDPKTMLFLNGDDNARGSEEFRTLRSRLYQIREKMTLKKILVTSALPKEGKSFTAANLAQVMVRQHGRRVLLIDADLRGPRLHLMPRHHSSPGLSDYLQGANDEFSIMQRGALENCY